MQMTLPRLPKLQIHTSGAGRGPAGPTVAQRGGLRDGEMWEDRVNGKRARGRGVRCVGRELKMNRVGEK